MKKIKLLAFSIALLSCCTSSAVYAEGAKSLFYRQINDASAKDNIGLTYSIELNRDGKTALVDNRFPFVSGDQLRFHVQSNVDGYLYILLKQGSKGDSALLFPAKGSAEDNHISAGNDVMAPANGVLEFDNVAGTETVKLVFSPKKLTSAPDSYSRSVLITPKHSASALAAEAAIEFALNDGTKADFKPAANPPNFVSEPAVTFVSKNIDQALAIEMELDHRAANANVATKNEPAKTSADLSRSPGTDSVAKLNNAPPVVASGEKVADKWAVVVGISEFKNPKWNLLYPAKDAQDFANYLIKDANFAADHVKLLTNAKATRENIMTVLGSNWLPNNAKPGDVVLIYFASHGTSAKQDIARKNFLLAYDTDPSNAFATGIEMQDLARTIKRRLNSDRIVIILDTCHSGSAEPGAKSLLQNMSFSNADLIQGTGQLIIASAEDNQIAHDSLRYKNGIFTKHLIDGLKQNKRLSDAFDYAQKRVAEESRADFNQDQVPVLKKGEWKGAGVVLAVPPQNPRKPVE